MRRASGLHMGWVLGAYFTLSYTKFCIINCLLKILVVFTSDQVLKKHNLAVRMQTFIYLFIETLLLGILLFSIFCYFSTSQTIVTFSRVVVYLSRRILPTITHFYWFSFGHFSVVLHSKFMYYLFLFSRLDFRSYFVIYSLLQGDAKRY